MKNKEFFTVDDHDELVADHVFYSHLEKRNQLISEIKTLDIKYHKHHLEEIQYEAKYLTEYLKARHIYGIEIESGMNEYEPFDVDAFVNRTDTIDAMWAIADDMRTKKEEGEFDNYMEAYRWAENNMTQHGKPIKAEKLRRAYHKAKSEGRIM